MLVTINLLMYYFGKGCLIYCKFTGVLFWRWEMLVTIITLVYYFTCVLLWRRKVLVAINLLKTYSCTTLAKDNLLVYYFGEGLIDSPLTPWLGDKLALTCSLIV